MPTTVSTMTLGQFIERMKAGWGFARPYRVQRIGEALDAVIPHHLRGEVVEVEYRKGSYGWGPDFHYSYSWSVRGVRLPETVQGGRLAPSTIDRIFGYASVNLPFLTVEPDGFTVGYDW